MSYPPNGQSDGCKTVTKLFLYHFVSHLWGSTPHRTEPKVHFVAPRSPCCPGKMGQNIQVSGAGGLSQRIPMLVPGQTCRGQLGERGAHPPLTPNERNPRPPIQFRVFGPGRGAPLRSAWIRLQVFRRSRRCCLATLYQFPHEEPPRRIRRN